MVRYLFEGGIWFMGTLSVLFLIILSLSFMAAGLTVNPTAGRLKRINKLSEYINSLALFTLVFGIFGQILGLVNIFDYLASQSSEIAPAILTKGIKITCYTTVYGIIIYLVSILISLGLKFRLNALN